MPTQLATTLQLLLAGAALCNDAILEPEGDGTGCLRAVGDPTEGALVIAAARGKIPITACAVTDFPEPDSPTRATVSSVGIGADRR